MRLIQTKNIILSLFLVLLAAGCAGNKSACIQDKPEGNIGNFANSDKDEKYLSLKENRLYYYTADGTKSGSWSCFEIDNDNLSPSRAEEFLDNLVNINGKIAFEPITNKLIFGSDEKTKSGGKSRLLRAVIQNDKVNGIEDLNADFAFKNSINPCISPDGKLLVFASPAKGGKGGLDLYLSKKVDADNWGEPVNLSDINTDQDENTPFIDASGRLVFASKGYSKADKASYDILIADSIGFGKWGKPRLLPSPINTKFDEMYPVVYKNKIFLSSNRIGGCGSIDIYKFDICGPIVAHIRALSEKGRAVENGTLKLIDKNSNDSLSPVSAENGVFTFELESNKTYALMYSNECFKDYLAKQTISTVCNDSAVSFINISIILPGAETTFSFDDYKSPFFVSGYYYPNTSENLEALKTKFSYNIFGNKESVRYIEKPTEKYDAYALEVDKAMREAEEFLLDKIEFLKSSCAKESYKMAIEINGYADPRPLSENARYIDASIADQDFGFQVEQNSKMTNQLLSHLRAYLTGKQLQKDLENNPEYNKLKNRISWRITGKGIDESSSLDNELRRRVDIKISIE